MFGRERHVSDEDLSAYLDEELDAGATERCSAHFAACEKCAAALDGLRTLRSSLRTLPAMVAPRSFRVRQAQVEAEGALRPPVLVRAMPLLGSASVVALVAFLALAGVMASGVGDNATDAELSSARSVEEGAAADSASPSAPVPEAANGEAQGAVGAPATAGSPGALYDAGTEQMRQAEDSLSSTTAPGEQDGAADDVTTTGADGDDDTLLYIAMGLTAAVALASGGLAIVAWRQRHQHL